MQYKFAIKYSSGGEEKLFYCNGDSPTNIFGGQLYCF